MQRDDLSLTRRFEFGYYLILSDAIMKAPPERKHQYEDTAFSKPLNILKINIFCNYTGLPIDCIL